MTSHIRSSAATHPGSDARRPAKRQRVDEQEQCQQRGDDAQAHVGQPPVSSLCPFAARCHVAPAATSITDTKARISASGLTAVSATVPSSEPAAAGAVKVSATRQHTWPRSASAPAPTPAAIATTTSEAVEAGPTSSPRT